MTTKIFCDACSKEMKGTALNVDVPVPMHKNEVSFYVERGGNGAAHYDICKHCIIDAIKKLDDRPAPPSPLADSPYVEIVFDGPPGPTSGRFIEVEDPKGRSISIGHWWQRPDGYWALRIPCKDGVLADREAGSMTATELRRRNALALDGHSPKPLDIDTIMPKGYAIVPVEPSKEMIRRGVDGLKGGGTQYEPAVVATWKAMLDAIKS